MNNYNKYHNSKPKTRKFIQSHNFQMLNLIKTEKLSKTSIIKGGKQQTLVANL